MIFSVGALELNEVVGHVIALPKLPGGSRD